MCDRRCEPCTSGQFQNAPGTSGPCMVHTACRNMEEFEQAAPTATSDRACQEYAPRCAVAEGYYESSPPLEGADRVCTPTTTCPAAAAGTRREAFNSTPMAVNSISSGSPHVRPMGRTCGEPDEIKKNTRPKHITALVRAQVRDGGAHGEDGPRVCRGDVVLTWC